MDERQASAARVAELVAAGRKAEATYDDMLIGELYAAFDDAVKLVEATAYDLVRDDADLIERALQVLTLAERYLVWLGDPLSTDDTSWTDFKEGVIRE